MAITPSEPGTQATWAAAAICLASVFRPILRIASWGGPMNSKPLRAADLGEVGVLAQEAVAGMDRLDVGHLGGGDDPRTVQVAVGAGGLADADGSVGLGQVGGVAVGLRIDRHDLDVELLAGADHSQCDFAAVGHQDPLKHRRTSPRLTRAGRAIEVRPESRGRGADRTRPPDRS